MFDRNYNITKPAEEILSYLQANASGCRSLRRRAVIYNSDGKWVLQACVVEGISVNRGTINIENSRCYSKVVLFEDWLLVEELQNFIEQISQGRFSIGEYVVEATSGFRQWTKERQPLSNDYMSYAGYVWTSRFQDQVNGIQGELLAPKQPYYPDLHEAVKDWLPFPIYHGSSDARKGEVILLLPETRAYFEDAIPHEDFIDLHIGGAEAQNLSLEVKGAWWNEDGIHHFSEPISDGYAQLIIPEEAKRLDYVLVDTAGAVYDFQQEDGYRHTGLGRKSRASKEITLAAIVRDAIQRGEGQKIEFKTFIYPDNDKIFEIYRAVAAFANAQGGRIFIGINDGCEIVGIDRQLQESEKAAPDEAACTKYLGKILGKIRDKLQGDVHIELSQTVVEGQRIAAIEVLEAKEKPVTILQDKSLYIRRGSSNTRASPTEWIKIAGNSRTGTLLSWMES